MIAAHPPRETRRIRQTSPLAILENVVRPLIILMFTALRTLLNKWFQSPPKAIEINAPAKRPSIPGFLRADQAGDARPGEGERRAVTAHPIPYDENLLERARTQWQVSDWGCHIKRFEHTGATSC